MDFWESGAGLLTKSVLSLAIVPCIYVFGSTRSFGISETCEPEGWGPKAAAVIAPQTFWRTQRDISQERFKQDLLLEQTFRGERTWVEVETESMLAKSMREDPDLAAKLAANNAAAAPATAADIAERQAEKAQERANWLRFREEMRDERPVWLNRMVINNKCYQFSNARITVKE